jgi:tetratricopeptide (TPR) repeat protein
MKQKKLFSSAIIPDELYVQRDADRKLKEVILRMSKPAYISVARQMGKTNLLIQTKRALQNETNRYVYIDITNKFETAQDCFRYIVNQILNSNEELDTFQDAKKQIELMRQTSTNNATEVYQNEIREILKKHKGNLVVFLDEVDDLRKHSFSDDIFGQIRKTYFINETYPVLKRITYVLSGVIDPEKLIKTKENSPFNIAIPIYLEDFNQTEFYELINKSEIVLENEIKEYIYDWLQGNPRMSFEILSIIEDEFIAGKEINKAVVDKAINDFYLTNFKNPPIDHIRDIVKDKTEVRKALIKLKKGEIDEITDEQINQFYLYGITASKTKKENLKIKNKVVELSLSDEWIEKVEIEKRGFYELGIEKIENQQYDEGIAYLLEFNKSEPQNNYQDSVFYYIGKAYHLKKEYEKSNGYLIGNNIDKQTSPIAFFWQKFYIGYNFFGLEKFNEALEYFEDIINNCPFADTKSFALINKAESYLTLYENYDYNTIKEAYFNAIDFTISNKEKIQDFQKKIGLAYYRIGIIEINENKLVEGINYLKQSLQNEQIGVFSSTAKYYIGKSYYLIGNHEISNQYLIEKPITKGVSEDWYYWQAFYIGANYLKLGNFEKSLIYFDEIIQNGTIPQIVINAMVNKGELLINSPIQYSFQEIESIYLNSINFINEKSERIIEKEKYLSLIYYRLGELYQKDKEKANIAVSIFEKGLQYSSDENLVVFYLLIDDSYGKDFGKRKALYDDLSKIIIEKQIKYNKSEERIIPEFNELQLLLILSNLVKFNLSDNFNSLLEYSLNILYDNNLPEYQLIYKASVFAINNEDLKVGKELQKKVINFSDVDDKTLRSCYQVLGILEYNERNTSLSIEYLSKYVKLFHDNENFNEELQVIDFNAFNTLIDYYREKKEYERTFQIAKIIEYHFDEKLNNENKANSIVILYFIMDYFAFIGDRINATNYGKKIISLVDIVKPVLKELSYVDKKGIENIEKQTKLLLRNLEQVKSIEPIQVEREPGRNEFVKVKYKNGRELVTKYKKVMEDIKKGECRIINN